MNIRGFFEDNVALNPDRTMFLFRSGGKVVSRTYAEVKSRIRRISQFAVRKLGLAPRGAPVAIAIENSPDWVELYLGHSAVAIPVVPVDPKLRPDELSFMLDDSGAQVLYTDVKHVPLLERTADRLDHVRAFVFVDGDGSNHPAAIGGRPCSDLAALAEEAAEAADGPDSAYDSVAVSDDDIASIIYTSGTTGHPKGAMLTNGNFCSNAAAGVDMFPDFSRARVEDFFVVLPLFHALSFTTNFLIPMRIGGSLQFASSLRTIGADIRAFRPSILFAVPLLVEKMYGRIEDGLRKNPVARALTALGLRRLLVPGIRRKLGGRIRLIVVGGAPCSAKLLTAMFSLGMPIVEGYGLTEAAPVVSIRPYNDTHVGTIGVPLKGVAVSISDKDENGVGELLVKGPNVMKGYLNNPAATAEAIDRDGWLHTGDLVSQDAEGFLTIRGRKKALIVNREGKNIYPEEVELHIARERHVRDVIVIGYSERGETGERIGAIVVPDMDLFTAENGGREPAWEAVEAATRKMVAARCAELAEYKTPRKIEVRREPLERTSAGKIRRFAYLGALDC